MKITSIISEVDDYARDRELAAGKEAGQSQGTAQEAYNAKASQCWAMLKQIQQALQDHDETAAKNTTNWGYVGDLDNVLPNLEDILHFLKS